MPLSKLERIDPSAFITVPWKNGGGTSLTLAQQHKDGAVARDWSSLLWQFGRTAIVTPAPFSDLTGFDRMQVLVKGSGLVLQTPHGDIDVRRPFQPVGFKGETPIVSRLENGPVEVVNLMAARDKMSIDLVVLTPGASSALREGLHILYAPTGPVSLSCDGDSFRLEDNHTARIRGSLTLLVTEGALLVATVINRS